MRERVIVSLGAGPQRRLLAIARRTIEPYAQRHGYDLQLRTEPPVSERPAPWAKIQIMRELVERYELVVWLDADLVIVDPREDIASELERDKLLYLVEHRHDGWRMPNTGVMMLRGGRAAADFLDATWSLDRYEQHRWWENAAVCDLLGYDLDPPRSVRSTPLLANTKFISPGWNWIVDARSANPRIRHFPGYSLRTRTALMLAATTEARARALLRADANASGALLTPRRQSRRR
ncbi:MAG TPA: hypothetical protein VHU13_00100 [Solirubrobacteraceae bacterium]|nr:hypothetical protein [Solirubrobacteraceae bacterium]